jgi:hypothetical protein
MKDLGRILGKKKKTKKKFSYVTFSHTPAQSVPSDDPHIDNMYILSI